MVKNENYIQKMLIYSLNVTPFGTKRTLKTNKK